MNAHRPVAPSKTPSQTAGFCKSLACRYLPHHASGFLNRRSWVRIPPAALAFEALFQAIIRVFRGDSRAFFPLLFGAVQSTTVHGSPPKAAQLRQAFSLVARGPVGAGCANRRGRRHGQVWQLRQRGRLVALENMRVSVHCQCDRRVPQNALHHPRVHAGAAASACRASSPTPRSGGTRAAPGRSSSGTSRPRPLTAW